MKWMVFADYFRIFSESVKITGEQTTLSGKIANGFGKSTTETHLKS